MAISYAERGGTKGYQVRVTRDGKQYAKFFNSKNKGAKKQASEYEHDLLELLGTPNTAKGSKRSIRTNTGIRNISEVIGKYGTPSFRTRFRKENGKWAARDVSIKEHGRTKALKIAKKIHRENHIPVDIVSNVYPDPDVVERKLQ
jgi:hypothetical protein